MSQLSLIGPPSISPLFDQQINGELGVIFDTETHHKNDPLIVEAAYGYIDSETFEMDVENITVERFDPGVPITFGAMATHHILPEDVAGLPHSSTFRLPADVGYVVGHNVKFDMGAAGNPVGVRPIDTLSLARQAWPGLDSYTQSALYYMLHDSLGMDLKAARDLMRGAHSASVDIQMCGFILRSLVETLSPKIDELQRLSDTQLSTFDALHALSLLTDVPLVMTFGKHEGKQPHAVPADYKQWYGNTENPDPNLLLAMHRGGASEKGQAQFQLANQIFGIGNTATTPTPAPVHPKPGQSSFSFR